MLSAIGHLPGLIVEAQKSIVDPVEAVAARSKILRRSFRQHGRARAAKRQSHGGSKCRFLHGDVSQSGTGQRDRSTRQGAAEWRAPLALLMAMPQCTQRHSQAPENSFFSL